MIYTKTTRTGDISAAMPLEEVKRALGIFDNEDDEEIQSIIFAAFELAETYCYQKFTEAEAVAVRDDAVTGFFLPYSQNVNITEVKVDGSVTSNYSYNSVSKKFKLNGVSTYSELEISYTCGFSKPPSAIDRGIKFLVSTILNSGQDFVSGMDVTELPLRAVHLLDSEKTYVV